MRILCVAFGALGLVACTSPAGPEGPLTLAVTPASQAVSVVAGSAAAGTNLKIQLTGGGAGSTAWSIIERCPWVSAPQSSGLGSTSVQVNRDPTGLAPGTYVDTVTVLADGAAGSPFLLVDTLIITGSTVPGTFLVSSTSPWPGSSWSISSETFRTRTPQQVHVGTTSFPLTRTGPTTFAADLPSTLTGAVTPTIDIGSDSYPLPGMVFPGYADNFEFNISWASSANPVLYQGHAYAVLNTDSAPNFCELSVIDLDGKSIANYPSLGMCGIYALEGPGPTPDPSVFIVQTSAGHKETWRVVPTAEKVGDYPELESDFAKYNAQLSASIWFTGTKSDSRTYQIQNGTLQFPYIAATTGLYANGVRLSPTHDRMIALSLAGSLKTHPVFDASTGQVVYTVPNYSVTNDAAFSADGKYLLVVGGRTGGGIPAGGNAITLLNAITGAILFDTTFAAGSTITNWGPVAFDPSLPLFYVGTISGTTAAPVFGVLVFDRTTFQQVGQMQVLLGQRRSIQAEGAAFVVSPNRSLYYVAPPRVVRFMLPSGTGTP